MNRLDSIRKNGLIPERRHDAFLLALLLAIGLNVALFAAQALLPHLAALLQSLGVVPRIEREEAIPFILVDPSFLDEETAPEDAAATAAINRDARQEETSPAEADEVYHPEGMNEQLMLEEGNPGEIDPGVDSAGVPKLEETGADANVGAEQPAEEAPEPVEAEAIPELEPVEETPEPVEEPEIQEVLEIPESPEVEIEEIEPLPGPSPEPPPPVVEPIEPVAEPLPLPPQPEEVPAPQPAPEPEPVPELVELPPEPVPQVIEPEIEPAPEPEPVEAPAEVIDLAMLPMRDEGIFNPEPEAVQERAQQAPPVAAPTPDQYDARDYFQPEMRPEEFYQPPQPVPQAVRPESTPRPPRPPRRERSPNAPQPTFQRMGGASTAGGAPPRRVLTGRQVDLFDDPYMALLRDRYPEYMTKLGRALQESLNRTMILYPNYYATGQARLLFRIAADGIIEWYETQYPVDGSDDTLRSISERTLLEAGPFDPPPPTMLADPTFRRMSLTVNIY